MMNRVREYINRVKNSRAWIVFIRLVDSYSTRVWMFIISLILVVSLIQAQEQSDRTEKLARRTAVIARQVQAGLKAQRAERARNIRNNCISSNQRNNSAARESRRALDSILRVVPPERQSQVEQSRRFTLVLIDSLVNTLAPIRNCDNEVRRQVRTHVRPADQEADGD